MNAPENECDCSLVGCEISAVGFVEPDCCPAADFVTMEMGGRTMTATTEQITGRGVDITPLLEDRPRC